MTDYRRFKIVEITVGSDFIRFHLDNKVYYKDMSQEYIHCVKTYPFTSYCKGEYLEIDLDGVCNYLNSKDFDTDMVRKVSSSEIVRGNNSMAIPSISQNQVNTIIGQINSAIDSDERNEYEAKIYVDSNGKYSGFSMIGRRK